MPDKLPPLVVVIPTHNRLALLERTIDSVMACEYPTNRVVRLVVIENGGKFGVEKLLEEKTGRLKPEYYYFSKPNKSDALNSFIKTIGNSLLLFFDDDIRVEAEIIVKYSFAANSTNSGKYFGGGMLVDYEEAPPYWLIEHLPFSARGWHPYAYIPTAESVDFMGCNWAAYSADIIAAGGFNPDLGPGGGSGGTGQETAMMLSLTKFGCQGEYIKNALVWHYVPKDRCSIDWTLNREFRKNITRGYSIALTRNYRNIGGVPLWMIRLAVQKGFKVFMSYFQLDPTIRFCSKKDFYITFGRIIGIRSRYISK